MPVADYVAALTDGDGFDVVYDTAGGASLDAAFLAVKEYSGRVVSCLGWGNHALAPLSFVGGGFHGARGIHDAATKETETSGVDP